MLSLDKCIWGAELYKAYDRKFASDEDLVTVIDSRLIDACITQLKAQ